MTNDNNDVSNFSILRSKLYDILNEINGPLTSSKLRNLTLYIERGTVTLYEIIRDELGLLADENSNIAREIQKGKAEELEEIENNKRLYSRNINYYEKFIFLASNLVQELALPDNSISASRVVFRLIDSGYLSKNSMFLPIIGKTYPDMSGFLGINIINGAGSCRHVTNIHKWIFDNLGLFDIQLPGVLNNAVSLNVVFNILPNHVANLIKFNGKYYLYDLSQETIGYFENGFTLKFYQDNLNYFYYKPTHDMVWQNLSQEEVISRIIEFHEDSNKSPISKNELNEILEETDNKFNQNASLLSDFKHEKEKYIKKIIPHLI